MSRPDDPDNLQTDADSRIPCPPSPADSNKQPKRPWTRPTIRALDRVGRTNDGYYGRPNKPESLTYYPSS